MAEDIQRLLRQGHRKRAFDEALKQYQTKVFRLVYSIALNAAAAEEITQDVFLKVWQAIDSYDPQLPFGTWLYAIARNTSLNHLRRESYRRAEHLDDIAEQAATPEADPVEIAQIRRMVSELPRQQREAVVLFYLQERSIAEVAQMLDIPEGTVKSQLCRARRALAAMMEVRR